MKRINPAPFVQNTKPKHEASIQMFNHPDLKTITITFRESLFKHASGMGRNAKEQYKLAYNTIIRELPGNYIVIAELTKQGNIHFHGLIYTHDMYGTDIIIDNMKRHKLFGMPRIDKPTEQHLETFKKYMLKDYEKTITIINKNTKHIDDMIDIVISSVTPIKNKSNIIDLRRWLDTGTRCDEGSVSESEEQLVSVSSPPPPKTIISTYSMETP